ncbi:MAG: hypothetical protein ABH869_01660 [Candidatus Omnitrophota bacterium]
MKNGLKSGNFIFLTAIIIMSCAFTGCAQIREKLIRKPVEEEKKTVTYQAVTEYEGKPTFDLYTKRYIFWKNWHRELLFVLENTNQKKRIVAVEQELSNLLSMQKMLLDSKAVELQKYIDELVQIETVLKKERITSGNVVRLRKKIETLGRQIQQKFSYNKVGEFIISEFRT